MFHIKWWTKQKMFSMCGVPLVERTSIGTKSMATVHIQIKIYTSP